MIRESIKLFIKKRLFFILLLISIIYTLPTYNKFWAPCDEGIILVAAEELLAGKIIYKDFFVIMYPPGQIYVMALLLKLFSFSMMAGRIYTVFVSVATSMLVFYMARLLTKKTKLSILAWFFVLVSLAPRLGPIPAPIWPGVFLALLAIYLFMKYLQNPGGKAIFITGLITGLAVLFRHVIGAYSILSIFGVFFILFIKSRRVFKDILIFLGGVLLVVVPVILYLMSKGATNDIINSLILFPFIHVETAGLPFPAPCLNLNMIFHGSLQFIKINQYYIPVIIYIWTFLYLVKKMFQKKLYDTENLQVGALLIFGIFTFTQVLVRTDPAHLLTIIAPSAILVCFIAYKALYQKHSKKIIKCVLYTFLFISMGLFVLLSIKNIDKYYKNSYRKIYKKDTIKTNFNRGSIYLPKEERAEVLDTIEFIQENTAPDEFIYVGNSVHWKDDFGGTIIMYYLAERRPAAKYYEFAPGLITDPKVQEEIKESLIKHNVKILILQDIDTEGIRERDIPKDRMILDRFIRANYRQVGKKGKYNLYKR